MTRNKKSVLCLQGKVQNAFPKEQYSPFWEMKRKMRGHLIIISLSRNRGNVTWAMLLFTADTLANPKDYQEREWGKESVSIGLQLALEAVILIEEKEDRYGTPTRKKLV